MAVWDHDGPGPDGPQLVVGGNFQWAGAVRASNVARWDGEQWHAIGAGVTFQIRSLAVHADGRLIAGGGGSVSTCSGGVWAPMGGSLPGVRAVTVLSNGDVVAAGDIGAESGRAHVVHWTGTTWKPLGEGFDAPVESLAAVANGTLIAGGEFSGVGSTPARGVARWNGVAWQALGPGLLADGPPHIYAVRPMSDGSIAVGGLFNSAGGLPASNVARWDGTAWQRLAGGCDGAVHSLLELQDGRLCALGNFTSADAVAARSAAVWDGVTWSPMANGVRQGVLTAAQLPTGMIAAAGGMLLGGAMIQTPLTTWNGTHWLDTQEPAVGAIQAFAVAPDGTLYAGVYGMYVLPGQNSSFGRSGGIYRRTGSQWEVIGTGTTRPDAMCVLQNGDLIVADQGMTSVNGVAVNRLARWDGATWSSYGEGINGPVLAMSVAEDGRLLIAGDFTEAGGSAVNRIAWWDGSAATPIGSGITSGQVRSVSIGEDGAIVASTNAIWRWDGSGWHVDGGFGFASIRSVVADSLGRYYFAGGGFENWYTAPDGWTFSLGIHSLLTGPPNSVFARWGGVAGAPRNPVQSLLKRRDGDFFVLYQSAAANERRFAMFARSFWPQLTADVGPRAWAVAELPGGRIVIGGEFESIGTIASPRFAEGLLQNIPEFVEHPQDVQMTQCETVQLHASVAGGPPPAYRWMYGPHELNGHFWVQSADTNTLTITRPPTSVSGSSIRLRVTTPCGNFYSEPAVLTVFSPADFNRDGDTGTDQDIEAFFACLGGTCCAACGSADVNGDGNVGTDQDIESFFRVLGGGAC